MGLRGLSWGLTWGLRGLTWGLRGWMDKWMDEWTDKNSPCVLQDFVPFGAAALLPLKIT